MKQLTSGY